jgi:hypothetical protein
VEQPLGVASRECRHDLKDMTDDEWTRPPRPPTMARIEGG